MKAKHFLIGILTFVFGYVFTILLIALFNSHGANGPVTNSVFNAGIYAILFSNLLICSTLVVCTLAIIDVLKNQK